MKGFLTILFASIALSKCGSTPQILNPDLFYKRDITVVANGMEYNGVSVLPRAAEYAMTIYPTGKMDLLLVTTCHREETFNPKSKGFLKKDNSFNYMYIPQPGIEDVGSCSLRMDAFDKEKGQHSWFFADFEGIESMPATVICNGRLEDYRGVSVCQSKAGLKQQIRFPEPVAVFPDSDCPLPAQKNNTFEYKINPDECVYAFKGKQSGNVHRHTTIGYSGVLVREVK